MSTRITTGESTKLADADVDETSRQGSHAHVDELEGDAIARYRNLRTLGEIVIRASLRADAYARLDAALASPSLTAQRQF